MKAARNAWRQRFASGRVKRAAADAQRGDTGEGHPASQNATAADPGGRMQAQPPAELPDGLEVEESGDHEAGGDDDAADASDVQAAIADLHVDGVLRERNEDDE